MKVLIVTPAPPRSQTGNRITALRWARILGELGHRVTIAERFSRQRCDVLVALHARRSAVSIRRFHAARPGRPLILALTGTDLYRDIRTRESARRSLQLADRLVLLQPHGLRSLPARLRHKARVIHQSVKPGCSRRPPLKTAYEAAVIGHLRPVKDPFRAAIAARRVPQSSRLRIVHCGAALSPAMLRRARGEEVRNPRYRWLGPLPHGQAMRRLARSRLMVLSSKMEGGANVVSEALAMSVPVLSSRISGSIGLLGDDYPGYFDVGDTRGLTALLHRAETDPRFYASLESHGRRRRFLTDPALERDSWQTLLDEFSG